MGSIANLVYGIPVGGIGPEAELYGYLMIIYLLTALLSSACSVVVYVLQSVGLFSIAKRRGIRKPWLAWIPVANLWTLGSISDQYQYVVRGKIRNRRKTLLGLNIALMALMIPFYICYFVFIASTVGTVLSDSPEMMDIIVPMLVMLGFCLAMLVVAVIQLVQLYKAYYDLFVSCRPNNAVTFLVLSIIFSFLLPFFMFACRKHDLGMPPRKDRIPEELQPQIIDALPEENEEPTEE